LVFRVCGWERLWRISSRKTRVIQPGPVEEKEKVLCLLKKEDEKDVGMRFSQCPW